MRPKPDWSMQLPANAFPLPLALNGRPVEIAVRVWKSPVASSYSGGGFASHPQVGSLALLRAGRRVAFDNDFASALSALAVDLLTLVLGCFGLGLYLLDRRNPEYAWFAVWAIGTALLDVLNTTLVLRQDSVTFVDGDSQLLYLPLYLAEMLFLWGFLKVPRDWMLWTAFSLDAVALAANSLGYHNVISLPAGRAIMSGFLGLKFVLVIVRVLLSLKAGNRDARLLIVPVCLLSLGIFVEEVRQAIFSAGWSRNRGELVFWSNGIVTVDWNDVFTALYLMTIGFALMLRFTRSAQEERRLSTEFAAAREIQQYLIPDQLPPTPGLTIHSVYQPSREVGGDFFQVLPDPGDGSTLIVVGDVAGKGLQAGMLAALIVGSIRTAFKFTSDPGGILALLNERLQGRGLVTCLAMHIDRNGSIELANAGHLPPYINGKELALEGAFPLGALPAVSFPSQRFHLSAGESLLLISDGVIEARNASGELFGFERTRAIATQSAEQIAQTAQDFGQEDDITVLTLALAPAEVLHA
jgi:sigma-B regulation protein RsbU (phosphoserine phosphatase)